MGRPQGKGKGGACYGCGEYGHKSRNCPKNRDPEVLARRLEQYDRPYPGYEWSAPSCPTLLQRDVGREFLVVCRSSGTAWPDIRPTSHLGWWYSDKGHHVKQGAIQLRDPDEGEKTFTKDGYYISGKHDFTCGFISWRIWESILAVGALQYLVIGNRQYLEGLLWFFTRPDFSEDPSRPFLTDDRCMAGRHRGPTLCDWRATWTKRTLLLSVDTCHDGLFRDERGPCGCGQGNCNIIKLRTRADVAQYNEYSVYHRECARDAYCDYMDAQLAEEIDEFRIGLKKAHSFVELQKEDDVEGKDYEPVLPRKETELGAVPVGAASASEAAPQGEPVLPRSETDLGAAPVGAASVSGAAPQDDKQDTRDLSPRIFPRERGSGPGGSLKVKEETIDDVEPPNIAEEPKEAPTMRMSDDTEEEVFDRQMTTRKRKHPPCSLPATLPSTATGPAIRRPQAQESTATGPAIRRPQAQPSRPAVIGHYDSAEASNIPVYEPGIMAVYSADERAGIMAVLLLRRLRLRPVHEKNTAATRHEEEAPDAGPTAPRRPREIIDSRFEKGRAARAVRCDSCVEWHRGNSVGTFWHTEGMLRPHLRKAAWEQGGWDASWYCIHCVAEHWNCSDQDVMEHLGFSQRQAKKDQYTAARAASASKSKQSAKHVATTRAR